MANKRASAQNLVLEIQPIFEDSDAPTVGQLQPILCQDEAHQARSVAITPINEKHGQADQTVLL